MSDNKIRALLESHPRMIGVLFTLLLLLSQAGTAMGGEYCTFCGP